MLAAEGKARFGALTGGRREPRWPDQSVPNHRVGSQLNRRSLVIAVGQLTDVATDMNPAIYPQSWPGRISSNFGSRDVGGSAAVPAAKRWVRSRWCPTRAGRDSKSQRPCT